MNCGVKRWRMSFWVACLALLGWGLAPAQAQSFGEKKAFDDALQSYNAANWERAEKELADFTRTNATTAKLFPDAILLRASANFHLTNYAATIEILATNLAIADKLADQFIYWIAKANYAIPNFAASTEAYGRVVRDYPGSAFRLDAIFHQAEACSRIPDWPRVIDLLSLTNGAFQQVLRAHATNDVVLETELLLAQAQVKQQKNSDAMATLTDLAARKPGRELEWKRQHMLGDLQIVTGHPEQALETSTNLVKLAGEMVKPTLQAESIRFQAQALEALNRLPEALEAARNYEDALGKNPPIELQRQATFKIAELNLRQDNLRAASQKLEDFLTLHPEEQTSDLALLTVGELRLRQHLRNLETAPRTNTSVPELTATNNLLLQASNSFARLLTLYTNSPLKGTAFLDLGWCFWADQRTNESQAAFASAARFLPENSSDQAVARLKLADIQFQRRDFAGAVSNYNAIIDRFGAVPAVQRGLIEQALYQVIQAAMEQNDEAVASQAQRRILKSYPNSFLSESSSLLLAQWLNRRESPGPARQVLQEFSTRYTNSSLIPEVKLAIARTYEKESAWPAAIGIYDAWLQTYGSGTNTNLIAVAEFSLAWDHFLAGNEGRAFEMLTNFVVKSSNHVLAAEAQYWIADRYARTNDFPNAERNYQLVFSAWPNSRRAPYARLNAGRMAIQQNNNKDAVDYFTSVINDVKAPPSLTLEARFAYGDTLRLWAVSATNRNYYENAIVIFTNIVTTYSSNQVGTLALVGLGQCYEAMADVYTNAYAKAMDFYQRAIDSPWSDVTTRSEAEVDLGSILEKMAATLKEGPEKKKLLRDALDRYINVVQGTHLREGEKADPFWIKEAGLKAGALQESLGLLEQAVKTYDKLMELLPSMRESLAKKRARANGTPLPNK